MIRILSLLLIIVFTLNPVAACASLITTDSFSFRRDAVTTANVTITNVSGVLVESKPGFIHSIVYPDGWSIGIGGADSPRVNWLVATIGTLAHDYDAPWLAVLSVPLLAWLGIGHLAVKYPGGCFYVAYMNGKLVVNDVSLLPGDYLLVTNDPNFISLGRGNDPFTTFSEDLFAAGHHRYFINYFNGSYVARSFNGSTDQVNGIVPPL